jgi:predicted O-methyltransferase YrrM
VAEVTEIELWRSLQSVLRGYRSAQVVIACNELGVFEALMPGARTAVEVATKLGSEPESTRRLLDAAVALGLLVKDGDRYANGRLAQVCLTPDSPWYIGHLASLEAAAYERWGHLAEAVRLGRWPEANRQLEARSGWVRRFELGMYAMARVTAPAIAAAVDLPIDRPLRLIDVGGGHGGYAMALARRYPNLTATVFELPAAAEVAREIIAAEGLDDRVTVQSGDFQRDDLGQGYDVALLFGVLVSESPEGRLDLLRKVHAALTPGGLVVIRELWSDTADPARSLEAALFSLHMLLSNSVGDVATLAEARRWLAEAGFEEPAELALPEWAGSPLLVARRPQGGRGMLASGA